MLGAVQNVLYILIILFLIDTLYNINRYYHHFKEEKNKRESKVIYFYILYLGKPRDFSLKPCEPIRKFPILMNLRIYKIQSYFSIK